MVGTKTYWLVDYGRRASGKREREVFKTKGEAETVSAKARAKRLSEGVDAFTMAATDRSDAARALEQLKPHGVSLLDAARYYIKHVAAYRDAPPIKDVVKALVEEAEGANRRPRTVEDLEFRLGRFAKAFGERQLASVTLEELQDFINDPSLSARSRINMATKLSQLWNYARRHKWVDANLVEDVSRPDPEDVEPGILTVTQCEQMLKRAKKFGLLPYVALGLFAGLRAAELERLDWSAVKLAEKAVIVDAKVAKKRSRRVVEVTDALAAWITKGSKKSGSVVDMKHFREHFIDLRKAAGIKEWPHNALRHSYGSYHLAMYGDAVRTAAQMGHRDPSILHNHYKALVTKAEAEKFWALRPDKTE